MKSDKNTTEILTIYPEKSASLDNSSSIKDDKHIDKLLEYINRNKYWTDKTINQLGYSINLFTTVGIGLLGYIVGNRDKFPTLEFIPRGHINFLIINYFTAIILLFGSILFGFGSILSRLLDFRITRHIIHTRSVFLSRQKNLLKGNMIDISKEKFCICFIRNLLGRTKFINEADFDNNRVPAKFNQLRIDSRILGVMTWRFHLYQIVLFIASAFFYGITIFK